MATNSFRQAYSFAIQADPQAALIIQDFLREQIAEEAQIRLQLAANNLSAFLILEHELGARTATAAGGAAR